MTGNCICGAISVTIDVKPEFINECNCSLCRKTGAAWGYFKAAAVTQLGHTMPFVRHDKANPGVEIHSCACCAATTHFVLTAAFKAQRPAADLVGVNMKLFDPDELSGVEVRFPNGKNWSGEGGYGFRRAPMIISDSLPW